MLHIDGGMRLAVDAVGDKLGRLDIAANGRVHHALSKGAQLLAVAVSRQAVQLDAQGLGNQLVLGTAMRIARLAFLPSH